MDNEPDYSKYAYDELLDARDHISREDFPERARRIEEQIARINEAKAYEPLPQELKLEFRGSAKEYFRVWIVNLCLTLLTFGIFSAWAKVRKKRYMYAQTMLDGTPFQYLGQPIPILKGRLIAATAFLVYYLASHFFTSLFMYVLIAGLILAPWIIVRSAAFNARYSAFRNMTFHFGGGYLDFLKIFFPWGILLVAYFYIWMVISVSGKRPDTITGMLAIPLTLAFMLSFPWLIKRMKGFIVENTAFGGKSGVFLARGGQFFKIYLLFFLIIVGTLFLVGIAGASVIRSGGKGIPPAYQYFMLVILYAGYVISYAYLQSRSGNLVWNSTKLGPLRFQSTLEWAGLLKLYVINAIGIVVSLGFLIPWAVMRTLKYRVDHLQVFPEGEVSDFQGSVRTAVSAVGAETMDFFDMDFSL